MTGKKFIVLLFVLFTIAGVGYFLTMPRGNDIPLTGVIDGNEVIVSPQMTGRIVNLTVDEGSVVTKSSKPAWRPQKRMYPAWKRR
jgi:multidrug resistance efflux pump